MFLNAFRYCFSNQNIFPVKVTHISKIFGTELFGAKCFPRFNLSSPVLNPKACNCNPCKNPGKELAQVVVRGFSCKSDFVEMPAETQVVIRFAKLTDKAFAPTRQSPRAAGYDLKSAYDLTIPAHGKELVKTDIKIQLPQGCYGRIAPRSGLALKNHIDVGAGVVDEDYRGNIGVVLFNHSDKPFEIHRGDRIAQLICERIFYPDIEEVKDLDETLRGSGGFGSTGTN